MIISWPHFLPPLLFSERPRSIAATHTQPTRHLNVDLNGCAVSQFNTHYNSIGCILSLASPTPAPSDAENIYQTKKQKKKRRKKLRRTSPQHMHLSPKNIIESVVSVPTRVSHVHMLSTFCAQSYHARPHFSTTFHDSSLGVTSALLAYHRQCTTHTVTYPCCSIPCMYHRTSALLPVLMMSVFFLCHCASREEFGVPIPIK